MSTSAQVNANRENSKLSTGPRTETGKAASSRNHLSHGLCSVDPVLPTEDRDEFNALVEQCTTEWEPNTAHTKFMVQEMAEACWKLARIKRIEKDMLAKLDDPAKLYFDPEIVAGFARLERHRAALERTYHRCVRALDTWQKGLKQIEAKFQQLYKKATVNSFLSWNGGSLPDEMLDLESETQRFRAEMEAKRRAESQTGSNPS